MKEKITFILNKQQKKASNSVSNHGNRSFCHGFVSNHARWGGGRQDRGGMYNEGDRSKISIHLK